MEYGVTCKIIAEARGLRHVPQRLRRRAISHCFYQRLFSSNAYNAKQSQGPLARDVQCDALFHPKGLLDALASVVCAMLHDPKVRI